MKKTFAIMFLLLTLTIVGAGCSGGGGGGGGGSTPATPAYTVGGTVSALSGSGLVLEDNGGDDLAISGNGTFTFATSVLSGAGYAVTVKAQPVGHTCTVSGGTGIVSATDVTGVSVVCDRNFFVLRVGDGTGALSTAAAPIFLEERSIVDGALIRTVALPVAVNGSNQPITLGGLSVSEGGLSLSADHRYLVLAGYAATPGTTGISSTLSTNVPRVVARVDAQGITDTSTQLNSAFDGSSVRAATSDDGTGFWVTGNSTGLNGGLHYIAFGAAGSTQIASTPNNMRHSHVFSGQLYTTSGSTNYLGVLQIGVGVPKQAGQTASLLPGFPTTGNFSPYSFAVLDLDTSVAGVDTLYVAQDILPGSNVVNVQKWQLIAGVWTQVAGFAPTLTGANTGTRGLAATVGPNGVRIVVSTSETTSRIATFVDDGSTITPAVTVLGTASVNTAYRGVALAPY